MMVEITIRECKISDVPELAILNKQLIDDEHSDNPMNIQELELRMQDFLNTDYRAYFFLQNEITVGYALVRHGRKPLYLRQFLIERKYRKQHLGTEAFQLLLQFLDVTGIDIEVLSHNEAGKRFWESLGFLEVSRYMRLRDITAK